jgi:hypothetical protein
VLAWSGHNCLRSAIATVADVHVDRVPRPEDFFDPVYGFDLSGYSEAMADRLGYRFRVLGWSECPPRGRDWVAVMRTSRADDPHHAIACRGRQLLCDPSGIFRAYQQDALEYGLMLVAA